MSNSMYSLILSDEVVAAVDKAAYMRGTNRSNMINQILAEYLSLVTPEQRVKQIFDRMTALLGIPEGEAEVVHRNTGYGSGQDNFKIMLTPSDSIMSLRSALAYKYNPTVRYSIELYREMGPAVGELRVSMRTQNSLLIEYVTDFFRLWTRIEEAHIGMQSCSIENGRYSRKFSLPERADKNGEKGTDSEYLGELIAEYISMFDAALKLYFKNLDDPMRIIPEISAMQRCYTEKNRGSI